MKNYALTLAAAGCALACSAARGEEINASTSSPVKTSTADNGAPGDITITGDGDITIEEAAGVVAATIDSNNSINNEGAIAISDSDNAVGLLLEGGHAGSVYSSGSINVDETYEREDEDGDDDLDGPLAIGTGRTGILLDASGAFTGDIWIDSGTVTVAGNDSAGVRLRSLLDGGFTNDGSITIVGANTVAVDMQGGVTGDITQSGAISAKGLNAVGLSVTGEIGGALMNEGSILATGFVSTSVTNYIDPDDLEEDDTPIDERIDAEDLNPGGPAVAIGASIGHGVLNNGVVDDFVDDEEADDDTKDTIEDFDENRSTGSIVSTGSAPALLISPDWSGTSNDIVVGKVVETVRDTTDDDEDDDVDETLATFSYDYGFINRGSISANGLNVGYEATAIRIEGSADGLYTTTIEGGIYNSGSVGATAYEADANAYSFGRGALIGYLFNDSTISATVYTDNSDAAKALTIEEGADLSTLYNSGSISASTHGAAGGAYAIVDHSGALTTIDNLGTISALVSSGSGDGEAYGPAIAIDLSSHDSSQGTLIRQAQKQPVDDVNGDGEIDLNDVSSPSIVGDVLFGAGNDAFIVEAGVVRGDIGFGDGADAFSVSAAAVSGNISFGAGADSFTLTNDAAFAGDIDDADGDLALTIADSTLYLTNSDPLVIDTLALTGESLFAINIDLANSDATSPRITALSSATIGKDATIEATVTSFKNQPVVITLIESPSLVVQDVGSAELTLDVPAIYNKAVEYDMTSLKIDLTLKTAEQLGLNRNQSAAYAPFLALAELDPGVGDNLTSYYDEGELLDGYQSLLPFTQDVATRFISDETGFEAGLGQRLDVLARQGGGASGMWVQERASYTKASDTDEASAYHGYGLNVHGGVDHAFGESAFVGVSAAFLTGSYTEEDEYAKEYEISAYLFGPYASLRLGGFALDLTGSYGLVSFDTTRTISFGDDLDVVEGSWDGTSLSGAARLSYEAGFGRYYLRPALSLSYFRLHQDAYQEDDISGVSPYAISYDEAETKRVSSSAILNFGRRKGQIKRANSPGDAAYGVYGGFSDGMATFRNVYIGYRFEPSSTPYETTAQFVNGGDVFTLSDPRGFENAVLFGLSTGFSNETIAVSFAYDGEATSDLMTHRVGVNIRLRF